jgi:membrane protease YdiL (CAAX protease family)
MDTFSQLLRSPSLRIASLLLFGASIVIWLVVALWVGMRRPVLPYQARRRVPWNGLHVLAVFLVFELVAPLVAGGLLGMLRRQEPAAHQTAAEEVEEADVRHAIEDLLRADPGFGTWLLCGVIAVLVAPVVEEILYRLLLQGWLEAEERHARRRFPALRLLIPGLAPVAAVSLLFALRHFRTAAPPMEPDLARQSLMLQAVLSACTLAFAVWLLRAHSGATVADLGFIREKLLSDVGLGLLACAAVCAPVLVLQHLAAGYVVPEDVAADPIPLFFLALALGTVYYRTHRIIPAIVTHMAFNATSLALFWLQVRAGAAAVATAGL